MKSVSRYGAFGKKSSQSKLYDDRRDAVPTPRARVGGERQQERDPREREVPHEEAIEVVAGVRVPHEDGHDAERRRREQSRDRQRTAVRQYGRTPPT